MRDKNLMTEGSGVTKDDMMRQMRAMFIHAHPTGSVPISIASIAYTVGHLG